MSEVTRRFAYTADTSIYANSLAAFAFLLLGEGAVIALLVAVIARNLSLKLALLGALALLYVLVLGKFVAILYTRHQVTGTSLRLRYGFDLHADVPHGALARVRPVRERMGMLQPLGARFDTQRQRIVACFSEQGQILLALDQPYAFRLGLFSRAHARELLVNVDDRDAFLVALDLAEPERIPLSAMPLARPANGDQPRGERHDRHVGVHATQTQASTGAASIRTEGLTRLYRDFTAVDHLSLAIGPGEIYGFLGPNGAGKTTTIKMLVGLLEPSAGTACIGGHDIGAAPLAAKAAFGYVPDRAILYERLTGREFLAFLAQMRGIPVGQAETRIEELLALLELAGDGDRPCGTYSFGMKRKLALAGALLHRPPVLILDEPLNGLDPRSARRLKDLFGELARTGSTIFLSTHDLATAESVCDRVGIIHRGRLIAEGSAHELRGLGAGTTLEELFLTLTAEAEAPV